MKKMQQAISFFSSVSDFFSDIFSELWGFISSYWLVLVAVLIPVVVLILDYVLDLLFDLSVTSGKGSWLWSSEAFANATRKMINERQEKKRVAFAESWFKAFKDDDWVTVDGYKYYNPRFKSLRRVTSHHPKENDVYIDVDKLYEDVDDN